MKKNYYSNNQYPTTQYRSNQTSQDILNNLPGYNYNLPTKEQLKNAIHQKYGFFPYPSHTSVEAMKISSYSQETFEMSMSLQKKMDLVVTNRVLDQIPNEHDWGRVTFPAKIWKQPNLIDKADEFREHLKTFDEKKGEYISAISKCLDMNEADNTASELFQFHDSNIGGLNVESQLVLEQFRIDVAGVVPDIGG